MEKVLTTAPTNLGQAVAVGRDKMRRAHFCRRRRRYGGRWGSAQVFFHSELDGHPASAHEKVSEEVHVKPNGRSIMALESL